jgi:hypothetical protein
MEVMTARNRQERDALKRLADLLVEDLLNTPDDEFLAEFKEAHGDPARNAAALRVLFEKTVIGMNKQRLAAARAGVAADRHAIDDKSSQPADVAEARRLLVRVLDTSGSNRFLTLAARKETDLSDADVLSLLTNLRELGIVPPDDDDGKGA